MVYYYPESFLLKSLRSLWAVHRSSHVQSHNFQFSRGASGDRSLPECCFTLLSQIVGLDRLVGTAKSWPSVRPSFSIKRFNSSKSTGCSGSNWAPAKPTVKAKPAKRSAMAFLEAKREIGERSLSNNYQMTETHSGPLILDIYCLNCWDLDVWRIPTNSYTCFQGLTV